MRILIVDDDDDDLGFFADAVTELFPHAECLVAHNGIEALSVLELADYMPDYIFLDLNMPRMDGKECMKHIKRNPRFSAIPLIIYSTSRRKEDSAEAHESGAVAFLVKPSKFELLKQEIALIVNNKV